jgi:hypothetical protein
MMMNKYEGKTLSKQAFIVEECFFLNCVLNDCDLFYSGGDPDWANVKFENCRWHFRGPARQTMQLMQMVGMLNAPQTPPPFPANNLNVN